MHLFRIPIGALRFGFRERMVERASGYWKIHRLWART